MGQFTRVLMHRSRKAQKKYQVERFHLRSVAFECRKQIPQTDLDKEIFDEDWYPRNTWNVTKGVDFDGASSWIFARKDNPAIKYDELQLEFHRGAFVGWLRAGAIEGEKQNFDREMISDIPIMKRAMALQKRRNGTRERTTAEALQLLLSYGFVPKKACLNSVDPQWEDIRVPEKCQMGHGYCKRFAGFYYSFTYMNSQTRR